MRTVDDIRRIVGTYYGVSKADLIGPRRGRKFFIPRWAGMFLSRELTTASFPRIGRMFGKDHTSAVNAVQRMPGRIAADPALAKQVDELRKLIVGS